MADNQQSESEGEFESAESDSESSTPLNGTSNNPESQPSPQQELDAESLQKPFDSEQQKERSQLSEEHSVSTITNKETVTSERVDTKSKIAEDVSTAVNEEVELNEEREEDRTNKDSPSTVCQQAKSSEPSQPPPTDIQLAQREDKEEEKTEPAGGGWGWGWGGLGNLLSSSVSESAQAIGRGIGSVVSTVEETLGVPSPQELVIEKEEGEANEKTEKENPVVSHQEEDSAPAAAKQDTQENQQQDSTSPSSLGGFWTAVQSTGMGIVSGGLDALETIGRKTVDLISEGDPGLQKKRAMLRGRGGGGSTLSQLLSEAKERVEQSKEEDDKDGAKKEINYSLLLDESGGLVHFEALELLSKECSSKLRTEMSGFVGDELEEMRKGHKELSLLFKKAEEDSEEGEGEKLVMEEVKQLLEEMRVKVKLDKLLEVIDLSKARITTATDGGQSDEKDKETEKPAAESLYEGGLRSLAELSTASIELLRKIAELSLVHSDDNKDVKQKADKLCKVVLLVMRQLEDVANQFAEQITALQITQSEAEVTDSRVTTIYLEASNSCSYIQDAFQLLLPILQLQMTQSKATDHVQSSSSQ